MFARTRIALVVALACATAASAIAEPRGAMQAEIRRTDYGAPHVTAKDFAGLGFGAGYALAEDDICEIALRFMTVRGDRSRYLGAGGANNANLVSDVWHRALIQSGEAERLLNGPRGSPDTPSADARAFVRGLAAGVSRYVRDTGVANIPDDRCRNADWVGEVGEIDYWRSILAGQPPGEMAGIVAAAPPGAPALDVAFAPIDPPEQAGLGSNAYGLGRETTKGAKGVLLGNPHYPWDGPDRYRRMHLIIPGRINVVGAGRINGPVLLLGHNQTLAWTHTVSTARRYSFFELKLDPADPTAHIFDGRSRPMRKVEVSVPVLANGTVSPVTRTLYATHQGYVATNTARPWTTERAFVVRYASNGLREVDQYIAIWRARTVRQMRAAIAKYQAAPRNTTAVDSTGEAFYADMGSIPHVIDAHAEACTVSETGRNLWRNSRIPVLDGSRAACDWGVDRDAVRPGYFGPARLPQQFRTDFVSQMNDSPWLTNPRAPLTGYPRIIGDQATERSLRTRLGLKLVEDRMAGTDGLAGTKFDIETLGQVFSNNRHYGGELVRDDLVGVCRDGARTDATLGPACEALAGWDLKVDLDSRGAHLFRLFREEGGLRFKVPFDPADPVNTPHTLDTADPRVLAGLKTAVATLRRMEIPMDAPYRTVQTEARGEMRIPIHGGDGPSGVFNVVTSNTLTPRLGWTNVRHGASFVFLVEFTRRGPVSKGVLSYSQSTNPASANFADQTLLFAAKGWDDLRFTPAAVAAGTRAMKVVVGP